ncbi:phage capsid protein [Novosphingobium sp. FGD1]|uniref:Phage capsid protein n=1 Tax=Novosphingobium silvae TaxID=2692619 RepID=A0A7X4K5T1_9SPHN|nr:GPO family capsid scaffolding protein [Novosphingobium silvae]MYL96445.1 phage capsid protein [Novosphingobium silvae]
MADPRFFRVAVEGDTTDGRKITRQDILDCAETFNPQLYGVRINLEHYRSIVPGGPFDMLGDVSAVKAEEIDLPVGNVTQKAMALFAAITPLPAFVDINKKKQKVFSSIEIGQNCRGTGKAYLVGMAATDSPASFGTEALEFAAKTPGFYSNRKLAADNLLCQAHEIPQEIFAAEQPGAEPDPTGILASAKAFFDRFTKAPETVQQQGQTPPQGQSPAAPATAPQGDAMAAFGMMFAQMSTTLDKIATDSTAGLAKLTADLAALTTKVDAAPAGNFTQRQPATGGAATVRTDC